MHSSRLLKYPLLKYETTTTAAAAAAAAAAATPTAAVCDCSP